MRQIPLSIAAAAAVACFTMPLAQAQAQRGQPWCDPNNRCVNVTEQAYQACFNLALQRGYNPTKADARVRNIFIYDCLTGKYR